MKTYISLFSSAGVGCYGFKLEGFECVATNELIERRLDIQRFNNKCKYATGYICGDITQTETQDRLTQEIARWRKLEGVDRIDVVIATPPCQGMSVANHKKTDTEIIRNSLVIESIKIIKAVRPRFFIFENVPAFMRTICTDIDGVNKPIAEAIQVNLGELYSFTSQIINFKDYGACSSRQRTVVIGVANDYADEVSPFELYPTRVAEKTLREVIGDMRPLTVLGEISDTDIYHAFRAYPEHMRTWIHGLREGESAFDNDDDARKPHRIIDGKLVVNVRKNGDKYRRQYWDRVGPCVHTRNDQLASQNTIHPSDDRVFSIRELMRMMTVPDSFRWVAEDVSDLNALPIEKKKALLKKEEMKIRQSLGEAVPTVIFQEIAKKIAKALSHKPLSSAAIHKIVREHNFDCPESIKNFIVDNPMALSDSTLRRIAELTNTNRTDDAAYYTSKSLVTEIMCLLPDFADREVIRILEPSVGVGNFLPLLFKKYEGKRLIIDLVDIDAGSIELLKVFLAKYDIPDNCELHFIVDDFILHEFNVHYDLVVGNPPFYKMSGSDKLLMDYKRTAINKNTNNICSFFLDKALRIASYVALVFPKFVLNTPEFSDSREYLSHQSVEAIIDFGEKGFPGVLIETVALFINTQSRPKHTRVKSITKHIDILQQQAYIFDNELPYWIIYRNEAFDRTAKLLDFGLFTVFRDRQITNAMLSDAGDIRVLKSRNISDDGTVIMDIDDYDAYIGKPAAEKLSVYRFLEDDTVYLTPNMTYYPRVMRKPKGYLVNGSVAILIPKDGVKLSAQQTSYFSSEEYRLFYQVARNFQTRSLNVDACSVFFFGVLRDAPKNTIGIREQFSMFSSSEEDAI